MKILESKQQKEVIKKTLDFIPTNQFKKDLKRLSKQGKNLKELYDVINTLINREKLDEKYRDHKLTNGYKNYRSARECHIQPNWLFIYEINNNDLVLIGIGTGSHNKTRITEDKVFDNRF